MFITYSRIAAFAAIGPTPLCWPDQPGKSAGLATSLLVAELRPTLAGYYAGDRGKFGYPGIECGQAQGPSWFAEN